MFFVALLAVALLLAGGAMAQDKLVKRTGEEMKVKVLSVTKTKVKFVRQGTEAPVYTLPVSDIEYIEYPTGDRDTFGATKVAPKVVSKEEVKKWHGPVPGPDGRLAVPLDEVVAKDKSYNIGEIYNRDGVVGIVVGLTDNGRHGVIMSLDEASLAWSKLPRKRVECVGASSADDGEANQRAVAEYIARNGLSWSDFPAFEWCRAKGEGWYLPAVTEVWSAGTMYMGGSRTSPKRNLRKAFNETIKALCGTPVSNTMFYHSSTECKNRHKAKYSHMNGDEPYIDEGFKHDELFVRAFYKF